MNLQHWVHIFVIRLKVQNDFLFDGSVISKHRTGDGFQSRLFMYRAFRILNDPTMLKYEKQL